MKKGQTTERIRLIRIELFKLFDEGWNTLAAANKLGVGRTEAYRARRVYKGDPPTIKRVKPGVDTSEVLLRSSHEDIKDLLRNYTMSSRGKPINLPYREFLDIPDLELWIERYNKALPTLKIMINY